MTGVNALIARFNAKAKAKKNVIALKTLAIYIQKRPGTDAATHGAGDVPYKIKINGADRTPPDAKTDAEGKIQFRIPRYGGRAEIEVLGTKYRLSYRPSNEAKASVRGYQRRLKMLGYHLGTVDGKKGPLTERAVLSFQADSIDPAHSADTGNLAIDGISGPLTQNALQKLVKSKGGGD